MNLEGRICRLRAVEPEDVETMYRWENDPEVWAVSGTTAPFSRHMLVQFVEQQRLDLAQTRQLRLIVETTEGEPRRGNRPLRFRPLERTGRRRHPRP